MSRIVYIECRDGRPHIMESGFGFFCETLTVLDPDDDEFRPYVPAADYDAAESRVRELEARIQSCMDIANGRWDEWGSRAARAANALDDGDREVDE